MDSEKYREMTPTERAAWAKQIGETVEELDKDLAHGDQVTKTLMQNLHQAATDGRGPAIKHHTAIVRHARVIAASSRPRKPTGCTSCKSGSSRSSAASRRVTSRSASLSRKRVTACNRSPIAMEPMAR